jgi:four helix bundle protein
MMSNIAEGHSRRSDREFAQFLFVAKASAAELESHLYCAHDRGYVDEACLEGLLVQAEEYARMVSGLISYLVEGK